MVQNYCIFLEFIIKKCSSLKHVIILKQKIRYRKTLNIQYQYFENNFPSSKKILSVSFPFFFISFTLFCSFNICFINFMFLSSDCCTLASLGKYICLLFLLQWLLILNYFRRLNKENSNQTNIFLLVKWVH